MKIEAFESDIISWQTMPEAAICFHELEKHLLVGWHPESHGRVLVILCHFRKDTPYLQICFPSVFDCIYRIPQKGFSLVALKATSVSPRREAADRIGKEPR